MSSFFSGWFINAHMQSRLNEALKSKAEREKKSLITNIFLSPQKQDWVNENSQTWQEMLMKRIFLIIPCLVVFGPQF